MNLDKLAKVMALAASDNDAEAVHALRTARRLLAGDGLDFVALAGRLAAGPGGADAALVDRLEDTVFDLRNELRHLRSENERLMRSPAAAAPAGLAQAAVAAAASIRLQARLAEAEAELESERARGRELEAENRRLAHLSQDLKGELARRTAAAAPSPPKPRRPAPRRSHAAAQYALF